MKESNKRNIDMSNEINKIPEGSNITDEKKYRWYRWE